MEWRSGNREKAYSAAEMAKLCGIVGTLIGVIGVIFLITSAFVIIPITVASTS